MGFSPTSASLQANASQPLASLSVDNSEASPSATPPFVQNEDDPVLPEMVASAPGVRPLQEGEAAQVSQLQETTLQQQAEALQQQRQAFAAEQPQAPAVTAALSAQPPAAPSAPIPAASVPQDSGTSAVPVPRPQVDAPAAATAYAAVNEAPKKRGLFATLFGNQTQPKPAQPIIPQASAQPANQETVPVAAPTPKPTRPIVQLSANGSSNGAVSASASQAALPGVRTNSLYEISRRAGVEESDDIDVYEGEDVPVQVASAAGLARLAPNGLMRQTDHVDVACLKPSLVRTLKAIENHFGRKVIVTSGYRNPTRNARARGAKNSLHMYCAAADVKVQGVSKAQLAAFARSMPGRGGVGTYCHTDAVHIDVGPERDWNWRCRRRK
ncbi:YcbK family protein [Aquamicrobium sp. cd-1]|uniref:YcbK family protein n=2 Tax=Aquamicrobium zhengzhouense TaxID=2781738 RepID=A0ABS0S7I6_9HYPH|nr:YcbK family protein [Aquamicrobium zhengzhouense]